MININIITDTLIAYDNCASWGDGLNLQENIAVANKSYYCNIAKFNFDYKNLWGIRDVLYLDEYKNLHYTRKVDLYLDGFEIVTEEYFSTRILDRIFKTKLGPMAKEYLEIKSRN